jgi:hypothetical protein
VQDKVFYDGDRSNVVDILMVRMLLAFPAMTRLLNAGIGDEAISRVSTINDLIRDASRLLKLTDMI